jgi:hypothetical protein
MRLRSWPVGLAVAVVVFMKFSDRTNAVRSAGRRFVPIALLSAAVLAGHEAEAMDPPPIAVGELSAPPATSSVEVASLRNAAEGEIRQIDATRLPERRRFVVSLALRRAAADGPVGCTVNAIVRDARTGAMIAIIEAGAHADGPASDELHHEVAHAAVRRAVRRIPTALGAK